MAVVSNTSPILNLAVVSHLHLLQQQFRQILIPAGVLSELLPSSAYPGVDQIERALDDRWLQVRDLQGDRLAATLMLELDRGEAEAIALTLELGQTQLLMDERDGRAKARALGLRPVGVLGVLLRAKTEGEIQLVEPILASLRQDAGFFIADDLYFSLLKAAGEQ